MGNFTKNRELISGSTGIRMPVGSSAERPDAPTFGIFRYNTDLGQVEFFNGTVFVQLGAAGAITYTVDQFTGDGVTTTFSPLALPVLGGADQVIVFVGSIYQTPTVAYSITGAGNDEITFTSAPPVGEPISVIQSST